VSIKTKSKRTDFKTNKQKVWVILLVFIKLISDYPLTFTRRTGMKAGFSPCDRMFACQLKLDGNSFPNILGFHDLHGWPAGGQLAKPLLGSLRGELRWFSYILNNIPRNRQMTDQLIHHTYIDIWKFGIVSVS
jgi:hypothetical protein